MENEIDPQWEAEKDRVMKLVREKVKEALRHEQEWSEPLSAFVVGFISGLLAEVADMLMAMVVTHSGCPPLSDEDRIAMRDRLFNGLMQAMMKLTDKEALQAGVPMSIWPDEDRAGHA